MVSGSYLEAQSRGVQTGTLKILRRDAREWVSVVSVGPPALRTQARQRTADSGQRTADSDDMNIKESSWDCSGIRAL